MAKQQQPIVFDKKLLLEVFSKIDKELEQKSNLYLIGGAAASIAYNSKSGTIDIDLWKKESLIEEAYKKVIKKHPHLKLPFGPAKVNIDSNKMLKRFLGLSEPKFKYLKIYVPDPEDLFLLKAQRADEKDIEDLSQLHKKQHLKPEIIFKRFKEDLLPLNYGSNERLTDHYLFAVASVFGEKIADHQHALLKKT